MRAIAMLGFLAVALLAGCLSDDASPGGPNAVDLPGEGLNLLPYERPSLAPHPAYNYPTYTDYSGLTVPVPNAWVPPTPVAIPEQITGLELVATTPDAGPGAGIAVFGHYVIASGNGPGYIVDIADPTNPVKVADLDISTRDADIIAYPNGDLVAVLASNGFIHVFDITDPTTPVQLPDLESGSHNAGVVPGTPIVYNANSAGGNAGNVGLLEPAGATGVTEIYDLTDPTNPVLANTFENGYGCHDITFYVTEEKQRAYCAGIEQTQIWDIADPLNPEVLVNIPVHLGVPGTPSTAVAPAAFSHLAMVNNDATVLIVGDETGGGIAPACDVGLETPAGAVSGPLGNLYFYDITDEMNPQLLSFYSPTSHLLSADPVLGTADPLAGCTAHFGRIIEDRDVVAMSFYGAGTVIIDFSDPAALEIAAQYVDGNNIWDVWEWQGYLYTGDLSQGVQVLQLV